MKFVIATGGTGGHLFPAIKVAEELKTLGNDVLFIGSFARGKAHIQKSNFIFKDIGSRGFTGVSFGNKVGSAICMLGAVFRSSVVLKEFKPDVVLGFGGYGAFPVVLSAAFLRYPTLIHEQNVVPGRANALLAKFVGRIAISFEKTRPLLNSKKTVLTGCPCRPPNNNANRADILNEFNLKEGKTTILVFGGSQGSQTINDIFIETLQSLKDKSDLQVIHISGEKDFEKLQDQYNQFGIPFALFKFLDKMEEAYQISDLVISRAGAVTVSEIALFQRPAILIPYPHADGHQKENAMVLCSEGKADMIEERDLSAAKLEETVLDALKDSKPYKDSKNLNFSDAAKKLAREALSLKQ